MHIPQVIKRIYRTFYWRFVNILSSGSAARIRYIHPGDIRYGQTPESQFRAKSVFRFIRSGDWDRKLIPVEEHPLFISFRDRFINKKDWQDTVFYRDALSRINRGIPFRGILTKDGLDMRFEKCDKLFFDIRENGYKSNLDLYREGKIDNPINLLDEITVNIDRDGRMILNDGWHRFSIARLLNITRIPVRILVRHSLCMVKRPKTGEGMNVFYSTGMYSTKYGGIERVLVRLSRELSKRGHRIFFQFEDTPIDKDFVADITAAGGKILVMRTKGRVMRGFFAIYGFLRDKGIDVIHANFNPAKDICVYAGRLCGVRKIICHFRTLAMETPRTGFRLWFISRFSDVNLAVSEAVKKDLIKRGSSPDKIYVLYDGSYVPANLVRKEDACRALHLECSGIILMCIAWDDPVKGIDLMLETFSSISKRFPEAKLWMVGSGAENPGNREIAKKLDIEERILWLGIRSDVPALMDCCDIYVQPSRSEGFGLTVAEAMACGKPVAAFRVGGIPEVVEDGVTGVLAQPGNTASLEAALTRLVEDSELRQKMGAAGRERVARLFNLDKQVARIIDWYERPV